MHSRVLNFHLPLLAITYFVAQQVGITDEEGELWAELEMAAVSISIHCRQ